MFENEPVSISKIMTSQRYSLVTYAAYDVYCTNRDWNTLDKILELDAHGYYMMNILDYLVGNTDRHWENWGLLVDNETNQPIRLHDLMDFNRAFQQYNHAGRCKLPDCWKAAFEPERSGYGGSTSDWPKPDLRCREFCICWI